MKNEMVYMTGLFGHPVEHSMSPLMHNRAFHHLQLPYYYAAFDVHPERVAEAVHAVRALGFRGVNVTIPHKIEVMSYLDELDEEARLIGAVNVINNENGRLIGYNTDGAGYVESLTRETGLSLSEQHAVIVGAGGAARAIAVSLARKGVQSMTIVNRTTPKAEELAGLISPFIHATAAPMERMAEVLQDGTLLINTTSVGMTPHEDQSPVVREWLHERLVVSDLVYNPQETRLLREAKQQGCIIHSGVGMLVHQGALAFEMWTGVPAPVELMYQTVLEGLKKKNE